MTAKRSMAPDLEFRIQQVALQCRHRALIRGWVRFGIATALLTVMGTGLLALGKLLEVDQIWTIGVFALSELVAFWIFIVTPLRNPPSLHEVALHIDQLHPELENRITSAVEFSQGHYKDEASSWMIERFLDESRDFARRHSFADLVDTGLLVKFFFVAASIWILPVLVVALFHNLWIPRLSSEQQSTVATAPQLEFTVEPGNARVRRGDHQVVVVRSDQIGRKVTMSWRTAGLSWQSSTMEQGSSEKIHFHPFSNIQEDIQYQIKFGSRRSEEYLITAWTPPEITSIDLLYRYPDYLELAAREVPNSGNITAVEGSLVELDVNVNKRLRAAQIIFDSGGRIDLVETGDLLWGGRLTVTESDRYKIELTDLDGEQSVYNPTYEIVAQIDKPPEIRIDFPRGDQEVTSLEEVPFDFKVSDDFGLAGYGIQYEVVGKEPTRIALHDAGPGLTEGEGSHELMLENLGLRAGDLITWTVWAEDRRPGREDYEQAGDLYFLEIRPFRREYEEAVSNQGGQQGGGQQGGGSAVEQKDVIIATWNLRRKTKDLDEEEFKEERSTIIEAQLQLLQKAEAARAMGGGGSSEDFDLMTNEMALAVEVLQAAELPNPAAELSKAIVHEQTAYRMALKLQPDRSQVQQRDGGGGGGGGQNRPEIDELEMDRNQNFYEEERRTQAQQQATDEAASKIKELAQRQKMLNEEMTNLISELQKARTEKERKALERRLEKLMEEEKQVMERLDEVQGEIASGDMDSAQSRRATQSLEQAREQMNRSLEKLQEGDLQRARSAGSRATSALNEIEQQLQNLSREVASQRMEALRQQMRDLQDSEREIVEQVEAFKKENDSPALAPSDDIEERKEALLEKKREMRRDYVDLMNETGDLAERAAQSQELMSRKLGDWLRETSREGIEEAIGEGEPLIRYGIWESAQAQEEQIERKLARAAENLDGIAELLVADDLEGMRKALDQLEEILGPLRRERPDRDVADAGQRGQDSGQPSDEPTDQSSGEQSDEGQAQQAGGEPSPDGQPGAQPSQEPSDSQTPGQGQEGQSDSQGQPSPSQSARQGGSQQGGADRGGAWNGSNRGGYNGGPWDPTRDFAPFDTRQFFESDYRQWLDQIRDAEALLPDDDQVRDQLERIRTRIDMQRREFRRRGLAPRFDLFLDDILKPLSVAASQLEGEILKRLKKREFVLTDDGSVPAIYRKRVADYFQALAETEDRRR